MDPKDSTWCQNYLDLLNVGGTKFQKKFLGLVDLVKEYEKLRGHLTLGKL
jgi:hypothetical protein